MATASLVPGQARASPDRGAIGTREQGLRIDLLLATPPLMDLASDVWIDRDYRKKKDGHIPSDHAPVIADLGT